jgi:hypothetical protein
MAKRATMRRDPTNANKMRPILARILRQQG